jgi:threonine/homoserine/homoserine lactone efflux protein
MSLDLYAAYLVACFVIVIVPGPTVTLIVANSLRHGVRAGLLNVAGTQVGLAVIVAVVGLGLTSVIEALGYWFDALRLVGAAYLVWLGWRMLRAEAESAPSEKGAAPSRQPSQFSSSVAARGLTQGLTPSLTPGLFAQGLLVALSNPKTLLFFGAFFPQFIDPRGDYALQIAVMGTTALVFAAVSDSAYALLSGRAGRLLAGHHIRLISRLGGGFLIGGGLWLALSRAR